MGTKPGPVGKAVGIVHRASVVGWACTEPVPISSMAAAKGTMFANFTTRSPIKKDRWEVTARCDEVL
jgi:hypothetical protein